MKCTALFFVASLTAAAQPQIPEVPHKLNVAGITLTIRDEARREIQKDVDALCQSPKHFNIKAERARTYFPTIEKIFAEERVPDDFKYLVLQESALIADAVSVSNAVGFWQFKDFTATEMGMRVDNVVDERMNIAAATRGAAKYIKRNNYEFNNWIYALQAYQMGAGGVLRSVKDVESGAKHMTITSETYWYVKKFLAHKIAFQDAVGVKPLQPITLHENTRQTSLEELAASLSVQPEELLTYNKWIRNGTIPGDRTYYITVPGTAMPAVAASTKAAPVKNEQASARPTSPVPDQNFIIINGLPALVAKPGENMTSLAQRAGISLPSFMAYNDLQGHEKIQPNTNYFAARKKSKAEQSQVVAKEGENLWSISQQHGVSLKKLHKYNRTSSNTLQAGQAVWLASKMPKVMQQGQSTSVIQTTDNTFFGWGSQRSDTATITTEVAPNTILSSEPEIILEESPVPGSFEELPDVATTVGSNVHTVQAGESLYSISRKYSISVQDLINWNTLGENPTLSIGQQLVLSQPKALENPSAPTEIIYIVKSSDTLYGIARDHGVTIKELMDWNNKKEFSVSAGERLRIVKK